MAKILVAEDEPGIRSFIMEALELDGHDVTGAADGLEAILQLKKQNFDVLFSDLRMPGADGMTVFRSARQLHPELQIIILTAYGTVETAVEAMKLGAFDYLQKPVGSLAELRQLAKRAAEQRTAQPAAPEKPKEDPPETSLKLTWGAPAMKPVVAGLRKVANTRATVLLQGESGCGKEVAAKALHEWSNRADKPFVAINCAVLSENLLESELFGHEKGAFTGATQRKHGRIEMAQGGTFFLDEVGEFKLELQSKLLRVLEEKRLERIGGGQSIDIDVRWVAATNRNLKQMVADGTFREDLYHRLAVFPIHLPSLAERREDIIPLAKTLLADIGLDLGKSDLKLNPEAEQRIQNAPWTGNIREMRNALERASILADGSTITPAELMLDPEVHSEPGPSASQTTLAESEREAIIRALDAVGGHRRKAADRLGIGLRTLYDKLKKYDLK